MMLRSNLPRGGGGAAGRVERCMRPIEAHFGRIIAVRCPQQATSQLIVRSLSCFRVADHEDGILEICSVRKSFQ